MKTETQTQERAENASSAEILAALNKLMAESGEDDTDAGGDADRVGSAVESWCLDHGVSGPPFQWIRMQAFLGRDADALRRSLEEAIDDALAF